MLQLSIDEKLKIFSSRNSIVPIPYRDIEEELEIDHSTLHSMLPRIENEIKAAITPQSKISTKEFKVLAVLALSMITQASSRSIQTIIKLLFNIHVGHGTILAILRESGHVARGVLMEELDLSFSEVASFDEMFQSASVILGFVDNKSGAILFQKSKDRTSDSWSEFLDILISLGLSPSTAITDGGPGLKKSLVEKFGGAIAYVLDLFHFIKKLQEARNKMEGTCYSFILRVDDMIKNNEDKRSKKFKNAFKKMETSIDLFDSFEKLFKQIAAHVYLANPNGEYISSSVLLDELKKLEPLLKNFYEKFRKHRKIKDAQTYLYNNFEKLIAYKAHIEESIERLYPEDYHFIVKYILPVIELHDRFTISYENKAKQKYWAKKILDTKKKALSVISEDKYNEFLNDISDIVSRFAKSNSMIENINNQVRRFLDTYKTVPSWFCDLFSLYWNFRKFNRGKRKGFAPIELLTGKKMETDWLKLILERFPYHKLQ